MRKWWFFTLLALAALLLSPLSGLAAPRDDEPREHAPDRILVKFQPGTSEDAKGKVHRKHGGEIEEVIPGIDVQVLRVAPGKEREKREAYRSEPEISFAELDAVVYTAFTPDDKYFSNQWGIKKVQAPEAWDVTTSSATVKVAILDTGIDQNHEDLAAKIVANRNFTSSRTVDDRYGHGTHVAGVVAAATNNSKGVAGVGYNSSLMNGKVLGDNGSGYLSWVANGIVWAADGGAKVINMSLGSSSGSSTLESAVNYAWEKGAVVVAAAGNSNTSTTSYPAAYSNVIAVAATDSNDAKASFSNYGSWVDVAAPGVGIYSTLPNHNNRMGARNYGSLSGTSMASPHVAGVAALVFARYPDWTNAQVRDRVVTAVDPTTGFSTTLGRVNALQAVQ